MVHDAVDDRCGEFVVREDRAPFTELDVRGEYDAPSFVAARDDLVEQARPVDVEGYVAELVQYDQVGTSAPFSSTARFNTPHEQCRSRAHASTLFDLSTTSATAHHTAASVKRLPSSAIWVRSSVHERAHAIHSYRLTRTSRCTACWPTGMCTNRRRHEERTRPMPPHSRQYRTVPSTGSQPISHTPAHEPAVTCLCETGFKRSLSKPSKTRPSNTLDSIPSRAVSFTFFNHTPNQTARPLRTKMRRAGFAN